MDAALAKLRPIAREQGLYLLQMPREHGGMGLNWVQRFVVLEEAGRSYLGPGALNCAAPDQPNMISLLLHGSAAQRSTYLAPLADGSIRSCFAMTEPAPGAGSDPSMLLTRAERAPGGWVISGLNWFITGAVGARFAIVLAQTADGPTQFIVATSNEGFRLLRSIPAIDPYAIGGQGEIGLAIVLWPTTPSWARWARALPMPSTGWNLRVSHCMRLTGRARRALELAQDYVNTRRSLGERLADLQQVQAMVADCHIDLHASRLLTLDCAVRMDAGVSVKTESAMAKVFVCEALCRVADRAAQLMAALGMSEDAPVSLVMRELRPFRIYDGASELHRATLGRRLLSARVRATRSGGATRRRSGVGNGRASMGIDERDPRTQRLAWHIMQIALNIKAPASTS
jgi:acyl-CoA dehydrogenase